ncbi:MAG: LEPR-XLL domain-containing protein, partial [Verrucomicrobia bacterium]|nr:LEPR-XLL domain-containing protein [Verrucomicrobiota bacterium]
MKTPEQHHAFDLEALEPRIMLSAEGAELLGTGAAVVVETMTHDGGGDEVSEMEDVGEDILYAASYEALFSETYPEMQAMSPTGGDELSLHVPRQVYMGTLFPGESQEPVLLMPDAVLLGQEISQLTVSLEYGANPSDGHDQLSLGGQISGTDAESGISWAYHAGTLTLSGAAEASAYEALLRTVEYVHQQPGSAELAARSVLVEVTYEDSSTLEDDFDLYLAHLDAGIEEVFENLDALFSELYEHFFTDLGLIQAPNTTLVSSAIRENTDFIPYVNSTLRDLVFPQRFVPVDGDGNEVAEEDAEDFEQRNNFGITLQPWDVGRLFDFGDLFLFNPDTGDGVSYDTLADLGSALSAHLTQIVQTVLQADSYEVSVAFSPTEDFAGFVMEVNISATKDVDTFSLELGLLEDDLGIRLIDDLAFGAGGGVELNYRLTVDLSDHDFDGSSIADGKTQLVFDDLRGTAGFQFADETAAVEVGLLRGTAVDMSGRLFASLPMQFQGGIQSRTIGGWQKSHFGNFVNDGGEIQLDIPLQAELFGHTVTEPGTKLSVFVEDIFANTPPVYTAAGYERLQAFALLEPEDVIQAILDAEDLFSLLQRGGEELFGIPLPFLENLTLGEVFNWALLFSNEVGNHIDVNEILLITPGSDAMADIRTDPGFTAEWLFPSLFPEVSTDALLRNEMKLAFIVNGDLATYTEIVVPASSARSTLDDLVAELNGIFNGLGGLFGIAGGGIRALNVSESLAFFAPAAKGIESLHLVPHPDAPGDLEKFALMNEAPAFMEQAQGGAWTSTFTLDPSNPLVADAAIAVTLNGQTEVIALSRIAGENANAMLVRLATAIQAAFGADKIALFAVQKNLSGEPEAVTHPTGPFRIRLQAVNPDDTLVLNLVNAAAAAGGTALGFFVGDNASTPRPSELRTFQDFVNPAILNRVPDLFKYDPATNTVSLGYFEAPRPGMSLPAELDLNFSFASVSQINTSGNLSLTVDSQLGFGFVIDFVLTPNAPITFDSGEFSGGDSFVLSDDAVFTVNFVLGNEYDVVVSQSDTAGNTSLQDLAGDINTALRAAVNTATGITSDLTETTFVARVHLNALQLTNAVRLTAFNDPFSLSNTNGVLDADALIGFEVQGRNYLVSLLASDTAGFTTFGQLIEYFNSQLANAFLDTDGNGEISTGDVVVSLTDSVFASTYTNSDEAFHIFTTGPPQPHWTFTANLFAEDGGVFQTELKFDGAPQGGQIRLTSTVEGVETRIRGFDGIDLDAEADLVFGDLEYTLPVDVEGTFRLGFNELSFGALAASGAFTASVRARNAGGFTTDELLSDAVETLDIFIEGYPADFKLSLVDLSSAVSTIHSSASIEFSVADFQALRVESFQDFALPIPLFNLETVNGEPTGVLTEDTTVVFYYEGDKYSVTLTAAETTGNTSYAELITQFNGALTEADVNDIAAATFDISEAFRFRAQGGLLQTQVLRLVSNPDYMTVEVLPDLGAYGAIGAQTGFSTQAVVDALLLALNSFEAVFSDPAGVFSQALPIINTPMNQLWQLPGDFAARVMNLQNNPASSAATLPNRIAEAFGLSVNEVQVIWDELNQAYRIEFAFLTGTAVQRPVDINPAFFAQFVPGSGDGLDRLIDGANRSPATFQGIVTFNIAIGIDLSDPAAPRYFLYEHDGGEELEPENGTSISVDFNIFADGIDFTSSKKALGLFIRDGIAILGGAAQQVNGETVFIQRENRNRTPYLLHGLVNDFANITLRLGNAQDAGSDGKFYLGGTAEGSERDLTPGDFTHTATGSVQVILPIYTPTEMLNPFSNRQVSGITLVNPTTMTAQTNATGTVGGNVFELRIHDFGQYIEDAQAWPTLTGSEKGAVQAAGNVELYVPDPVADAGIETPTLLDLLRDPALILDGIDFFFGVIQAGLSAIGSIPIPIVGDAFQGAANTVFAFRDGWLRDMRNRLRGAGEAFGQLVKDSIFELLGPGGAGILLQRNGISGLDGQVQAENPDDILFDWLDKHGNSLTDMGGFGAHGLEFQIRLGQLLFDTGFSSDLNFDALAPVINLGMDGGFGFAVGWDLQIGFGFNVDDGFYIRVDGDRNELEVRVEGTLRGAQDHFEVRAVNDPDLPNFPNGVFGTGYAIWNRRDQEWVLGPAKGDGSRDPIHVINVNKQGQIVDPSEWQSNLIFGSDLLGGSSCGCSGGLIDLDEPELFWVVAAFDDDAGEWVPAYLDTLGQFRAQENGSFDPGQMILYDRAQPFSAFGSLFFLNLEANDQIRIGLDPPGDADYAFGIDKDQKSPNDRNDASNGVRRNNHLPSRARASIGINLWDPSSQSSKNNIQASTAVNTNWVGVDWNGEIITELGLPFTGKSENGFPVVSFNNVFDTDNGDLWFIVHLLDKDNANDIRDYFNKQLEAKGWTLEVERRPGFSSSGIAYERISIVDGVWSYLDSDDEWQPVFEEDWTFFIRVPDEFGGSTYDLIRVKYIQLGDDYYDILENGTGWYIVDPDYSGVAAGAQFDTVNGLLNPIFLFDEIEDDWLVPLFMLLSTDYSLNTLVSEGNIKTDTFPGQGGTMPQGVGSDFTNLVRWGYWLPVLSHKFDASENMITWEELRGNDSAKIIQLVLRADIIVNLSLELSVSDNAAFPKIRADLNLDWGIDVNFRDENPFGEVNWYPHVGMNNIRLDMGSFLTQYLRPVLEQIDEGLSPIRPVIEVLTEPIPVISDIAGRDISLSNLLYQFGGPKGQAIATFIDVVRLVSDLSAMVAALPDDMNVYLPIGNFWIPSGKNGLEDGIFYDNNELTPPSFSQQNQALTGDNVEAAAGAFGLLNDANKANQPNNGITNNNKKGGFAFPIFSDPTQVFSLLMGGDAVLITYSLPQIDFSFNKRIPLIKLGPFQAGMRFGFEITAQLHFGFDTYGVRKAMDTGNPLWAIDGLYISDRQNADGTGRDIPEVTLRATIALYGGIDVYLARGGIEGGFTVGIDIDLNDPNDDGKVRPSELLAVVEWTGNPLDWFNIRIYGEVYARYYYKVMIPVPYFFGIRRVTLYEGGKTFAHLTLFDIQWEGSKGPPILGEKINFVTPKGDLVENALLINMGPNSANRITNDDPWYSRSDSAIIDGNEKFVITNSGSSVTVTLYNRTGTSVVHSMTFHNVSMVVAYAGEGNDIIDATGLNGMPVYFEGSDGNNQFTVGSTHETNASWLIGGAGNDTLNVINGGYTYFNGVSGSNAISLGQGSSTVNVVQTGRDEDDVTSGGNGAVNTVNVTNSFGNINLSGMAHNSQATTLDFSRTFFPLSGEMSGANSFIEAGGRSRMMFHLAAITEIKGGQNRDTFTFSHPQTHQNGLMLRGGLGNDVFTFVLGDFSQFTAAGITIDNDILPASEAILGTVVLDDCDGIFEIGLASYTVGNQTFFHSGTGYLVAPEVRIVDPTGTGARAIAGLNTDGTISGIVVTNRGSGYTNPTIELVNRTSFNDTVRFILEDTSDYSQDMTLERTGGQQVLTYENREIRMADSVENITIEAPGATVAAGQGGVRLEGRFQLRAERFIHTGPITADTVMIVTDQGFAVDHPIAAMNHGNISLEVLGRGERALATPVISGSQVSGYTLDFGGSHYNFTPQVVVRGGSSGAGSGAFAEGVVNSNGEVTGFTVLKQGYGYSSIPVPDAYVTSPSSIYLNASLSSSALGSPAGYGDGRGTITLRTLEGSVLTSADVNFPSTSQITWENGDFRFLGDQTLDDIHTGGSGAEAVAVLDDDGRVIGFNILQGGSGYTSDYAPTVRIQGAAEATAIVENGQVVGFNITNPGNGYAVPPLVTLAANGLSKVADAGQTKQIKAANGFLVIDTDSGIGTIHRPVQTDVRVFVGRGALEGDSNLYILENNGFDIGSVDGINGVTTESSDIHLVSFSGDINLGMPVQRTNSSGDLLWQDPDKTIPIYETYQEATVIGGREFLPGDLVYVGGNLNAKSGNIVLVADNFNVNAVVSSTGAILLSLRPANPTAPLGLAGSRAVAEAVLDADGTVIGLNLIWQGRGYTDEPLVIFNAPGDRAFAVASALNGSVSGIEITYGGSFYDSAPVITLSAPNLAGGTQATAQAVVSNGQVIGIEILNAGSGYTAAPRVNIALPGDQATARAQVQNGRVVGFFDLSGGSNYSFVPRVTIEQPFTFGLDQFEIDFFQAGFDNFEVGRKDGRNRVVTATQQFQETTILRGDAHFFENTFVDGDLIVYGSGNTSYFDTGTTEADSISFNDALIINAGQTHTFRATAGGILFQLPGTLNGTLPNSSLNPANQENVILDATGNIQIVGAIGNNAKIHNLTILKGANITFNDTITLSGDLIIEQGAQITFERDVRIDGNLIIGSADDLTQIGSVTFTPGARLDVQGNIEIYSNGAVNFRNDVGQVYEPDSVVLVSNGQVNFEGRLTAVDVDIAAGSGADLYFNQQVIVQNMTATAGNLMRVDSSIRVGTGDLSLTANRIELRGGAGSIFNQTGTGLMSRVTLKPFDVNRNMTVGEPALFFGLEGDRLDITYREIRALGTQFAEVIFGDIENGTGKVFVSDLGITNNNLFASPPSIVNPTTIVGGDVQVGYANRPDFFDPGVEDFTFNSQVNVSNSAGFIRFKSLVLDVRIDAAVNTVFQRNAWVRIEAERNIIINKAVYANDRISLTGGYNGGIGNVTVNSAGPDTGTLWTTSTTTANRRIEVSAGVDNGNILFNDDVGGVTLWAAGADSEILLRASSGTVTQNNGLIRGHLLAATALGNIRFDLTEVVRVDGGTISGDTYADGNPFTINGIIITGDPDFIGSANLRMTETDSVILVNVQTNGGDIFIDNLVDSAGNLALGTLGAVRGEIRLVADGAITDFLAGDEIINLTTTGIANLTAKTGIGGPGDEDIDTNIGSLTAQTTVSGGIHIDERDGLLIVGPVTTAGNGPIILSVREGNLNVANNVAANGSGNILLEVLQGAANIGSSVSSTEGHISITAEESINLLPNGSVSTGEPGTVFIHSAAGRIVMSQLTSVTATGSSVYLTTTGLTEGDIILAAITAARVSVVSANFSIFTALVSSANVTATDLRLEAARAIGTGTTPIYTATTRLAAYAGGANPSFTGIFLQQTGEVTVSQIAPVEVQIVDSDNLMTSGGDAGALADVRTGNHGSIVLVATGSVTLNDGNFNGASVVADQSGNIIIRAVGETADLTVNGAVLSETGHITLRAERDIVQNDDITTGTPGTVLILAESGSFTMDREVVTTATDSSVLVRSEGTSTLGLLVGSSVSVRSFEGSIFSAADSAMNVTATNLRLEAKNAIGTEASPLLTTVDHLTARADSASADDKGLYILNAASVTVRDVEVTVQEVLTNANTSGVTETSQSDLVTANEGDIVLSTVDGTITLTDANGSGSAVTAAGGGDVILTANGADRDIIAENDADILGGTGDITLTANRNIVLNAGTVDVITAGDAEIFLTAANGFIYMTDGSTIVSEDGGITLFAYTDIDVSRIQSDAGDLFLHADTGAIRDNTALEDANLVTGGTAHLKAAAGIGSNAAPEQDLNTRVAGLTALNTTSGDIILQEETGFTLTGDDDLTDGGVVNNAPGGDIRILTLANRITVDGEVRTSAANTGTDYGHIALRGIAAGTELVVNAAITATNGHITLRAHDRIEIYAPVEATGIGTLFVYAPDGQGEIFIENNGVDTFGALITANQNILLEAGLNVQVAGVDAGTAAVEIAVLNGSIQSGSADDITAMSLRLRAFSGIGAVGDPLRTHTTFLSAYTVSGPIQISNSGSVTIDTVGTIGITEVLYTDGLLPRLAGTPGSDQSLSDIRTDSDGDILIVSETGSVTINDGVNADGIGIQSAGGSIVVEAATFVLQAADILTNGSGTISVEAKGGDVTMVDGTISQTEFGMISYTASGDIFLSLLESTAGGDLYVDAGDRIRDNTFLEEPNLRTTGLATLLAVNGIGDVGVDDINLHVGSVRGLNSLSGRIVLREVNTLEITPGGLMTLGGNGDIIVTVDAGHLTVNGPVTAHGSGSILLETLGVDADILINQNITSTEGHITLQAARSILIDEGVTLSTETSGTISLDAVLGSIAMAATAAVLAVDSSARLSAGQNMVLGQVNADAVSLIAGGDLTRAVGSPVNVQADQLRIHVQGGVATSAEKLLTDVNLLSARAVTGDLFIHNLSELTVGTVTVSVSEFTDAAGFVTVIDAAQSGLTAEAGDVVLVSEDSVSLGLVEGGTVTLLVTGDVVHLPGSGTNVIADSLRVVASGDIGSVTEPLEIEVGTLAATAENMYIHALGNLLLGVVTDTEGSDNGLIATGDIVLSVTGDLSMGPASGIHVDLSSGGEILNVTGSLLNITAEDLTLTAEGHIGTLADPIRIDAGTVRGQSATGSIYLDAAGDLLVDSLTAVNDIILNVEDSLGSAPGAVTNLTANRVRIVAGADIGPLTADINILAARSDTVLAHLTNAGALTLGTIEGLHGVTAETGVTLTTLSGRILDGGDLNDDVISNGPVTLTGAGGLGTTGAGAL